MCTKERFKIFMFGVQAKIGGRFSRISRLPVEIHFALWDERKGKERKGNGMHEVLGSSRKAQVCWGDGWCILWLLRRERI